MAALTLLPVDTIYLTYDGYTAADTIDYADSPSTRAEKIADSSTYLTKVRSLTVGGDYTFTRDINTLAVTTGSLNQHSTSTVNVQILSGDNFVSSGYALIGAEVISYASTTETLGSTTSLDTLERGLASTEDVTHSSGVSIIPVVPGTIVSIEHNKDDDVFHIHTSCTIPNAQYGDIVENNLIAIPETNVSMVKYVA